MKFSKHWLSQALWNQFQDEQTTAHRVYTSNFDYIERFGDDLLISLTESSHLSSIQKELSFWLEEIKFSPQRIFQRNLVKNPKEKDIPTLLEGDASMPRSSMAQENGASFEIDFSTNYSVGLFMDQRENRKYLRSLKPKKLLNCFSYTGAFSVAAALEGAETLSVDISKPSLERCKRNFALNNLSIEKHRFIADDVGKVLPRLENRGEKFDAIILDPPTFSRTKEGAVFKVERDFTTLLELALACASPQAYILLSTNSRSMTTEILKKIARKHVPRASFLTLPPPADIPAHNMPSTLWMASKGSVTE